MSINPPISISWYCWNWCIFRPKKSQTALLWIPSFLHRDSKHLQLNQELEKMTISSLPCHTDRTYRSTCISLLLHYAAIYLWWIEGAQPLSAPRNVTVSLAVCSLSLERPRPNPAICWLHPGEQKLIPADDPKHPVFPLWGKDGRHPHPPAALLLFIFYRSLIMIFVFFKHDTCASNSKCS